MFCRRCGAPIEEGRTVCSSCESTVLPSDNAAGTALVVHLPESAPDGSSVKVGKGLGIASFVLALLSFFGGIATLQAALLGTGVTCFGTIYASCGCFCCSGVCCGLPGGLFSVFLAVASALFAVVSLILVRKKRKIFAILGLVISLLSLLAVASSIVIAVVPEVVHSLAFWLSQLGYAANESASSSGSIAGSL